MFTLKKHELEGHDVFEIMKGTLKEHWLEDSIYITEECFMETEMKDVLDKVTQRFNYLGPTEISLSDWELIKNEVYSNRSETTKQLVSEIDEWAKECFKSESCFTICGI